MPNEIVELTPLSNLSKAKRVFVENKLLIILQIIITLTISLSISFGIKYNLTKEFTEKSTKTQEESTTVEQSSSTKNSTNFTQSSKNSTITVKNYTITNDDKAALLREMLKTQEAYTYATKENIRLKSKITELVLTTKDNAERAQLLALISTINDQIETNDVTLNMIGFRLDTIFDTELPVPTKKSSKSEKTQ